MKNNLKTAVLLAAIGGLMIVVGGAIGGIERRRHRAGDRPRVRRGLVLVQRQDWPSRPPARSRSPSSRCPATTRSSASLAERTDMPMPKLYVSPDPQPNAFATGRSPAARRRVRQPRASSTSSPGTSCEGVLAHEISHVHNRDILIGSVAAAVAMGITFVARMAMWGAMFGGGDRRPRQQHLRHAGAGHPGADRRDVPPDGAESQPGVRSRPQRRPPARRPASPSPGPSRSSSRASKPCRATSTRRMPRPTSPTRSPASRCSSRTSGRPTRRWTTASAASGERRVAALRRSCRPGSQRAGAAQSRKFCELQRDAEVAAPSATAMTAWRSSRFLPVTRS